MKPSKSIEILELNIREGRKTMPLDVAQALGLGIEALKRNLACRTKGHCEHAFHLPGETEE